MARCSTIEKTQTTTLHPEQLRNGRSYLPAVDIYEKPDELVLVADVPGASADSVAVQYEQGILTIHARVEPRLPPDTNLLLNEYGVGDYHRTFQIGEGIAADRIEAEVANGLLTLHLPKAEAAKTRKIKVKAST